MVTGTKLGPKWVFLLLTCLHECCDRDPQSCKGKHMHTHPHVSTHVRQTDRQVHNQCLTTDTHRNPTHPGIHSPSLVHSWPVQPCFEQFCSNCCGSMNSQSSAHIGSVNNFRILCMFVSNLTHYFGYMRKEKSEPVNEKAVCPTLSPRGHWRHRLWIYLIHH